MAQPEQEAPEIALPNYLLQIDMVETADPCITRTLSVPAHATFHNLHNAIQAAFDWGDCHLHSFEIFDGPADKKPSLLRRKPATIVKLTPSGQSAGEFGNFGQHPPTRSSKKIKLLDVFEREGYKDKAIEYLYDFGDNWVHSVTLIGRAVTSTKKVVCLSGEGCPVAEDCGGAFAWAELKEHFQVHVDCGELCDEDAHDRMAWYAEGCPPGESKLQPWKWDRKAVNKDLQRLRI